MMQITVRMEGNPERFLKSVQRFPYKFGPAMVGRYGNTLVQDQKKAKVRAGVKKFTGFSDEEGIRFEHPPNGMKGYLLMRQYLLDLDSMSPHVVSVRPNRQTLLRWAKQAQNPGIRAQAQLVEKGIIPSFALHVSPHPFFDKGFKSTRNKTPVLIRKEIESTIRRIVNK